jgi:hypothetical protein
MKLVSTNLLAEIQANVTTLATCIEIRRTDGKTYRLTNHDTALTVDGNVYDQTIPFNLAAIASGSNFGSDNTELTLFIDGTVFTANDFNSGSFTSAAITIMLVNFLDTSDGKLIFREGWFGPIDTNTYGIAKITIYGMLKVLDIEIGRVYQPSCDADFGDKRCRVALKQNQVYDTLTNYRVGDWVYYFDPTLATAITVVNPSFEVDAPVAAGDPIPGWTRSADNDMEVLNTLVGPYAGSYYLFGGDTAAGRANERHIYQDIDLIADGLIAGEIDDGQISFIFFANLAQTLYLFDPVRLRVEVRDADQNVIDSFDDGYVPFEEFDQWYQRGHGGPLLAGARYIRIYIYMSIKDGVVFNAGADNIRGYWWNHLAGSPNNDLIHKVTRISDFGVTHRKNAGNGSFETGAMSNSNVTAIPDWTRPNTTADWWRIASISYLGIPSPDQQRMLVGGDDSSGTQKTYELTQTLNFLTDFGMDAARIDLGKMVGKLNFSAVFFDTVSSSHVLIEFLQADNTTVTGTITALDFAPAAAPGVVPVEQSFVIPTLTRNVRLTLSARSAVGASNADVGFDHFYWTTLDAELPRKDDPIAASGNDIVFADTAGAYTIDQYLIWKAHTMHLQYDEVSVVTNRKLFVGTTIAGVASTYSTSLIRWISGANAGQRNLIRAWNPDTKAIKLYFPCTNPIQVGDRFQYVRACHKRFVEDCALTFDNVINFRGFPHLPGKLKA